MTLEQKLWAMWTRPQRIERLAILRIFLSLAILGFYSGRYIHADHWIGNVGFAVPEKPGGDWRQPIYLPRLEPWAAWMLAGCLVASGVAFASGVYTRVSGLVFASLLLYVALADRLEALTVSKLSPVLIGALAFTPCGLRWGFDAWRARRKGQLLPTLTTWGNVRFFQALISCFYLASGICKARGDWLSRTDVLWTQLHDSYQTPISVFVANHFPTWSWVVLQAITLAFECLAPLWFAIKYTRGAALAWGLAMHLMIGLLFGPVVWFSILMMTLLTGCFVPDRWLGRLRYPRRVHRETVDVAALAREVETDLKKRAPDRKVELKIDEPLTANADRALLGEMLATLLGLAWELTRGRRIGHVKVGTTAGPDGKAYFVRDDGLGSASADDPDLAGIAAAAARHGGRMWTEAAPGAGATIYFTLGPEDR